jgi:Flp pilus assembly protein TadB
MDDMLRFGSRDYCLMVLLLAFARSMDFISTWVATPNLVLEGNPIAKKLGWRWGIILNVGICFGMSFWLTIAIAISTMSVLVAARNFQSAWLMRSMGEENYRDWHVRRIQETPIMLYLLCLAGNTLLSAAVGIALIFLSGNLLIPLSIGMGIVTYAVAVAFYTTLAIWRMRRAEQRKEKRRQETGGILINDVAFKSSLPDSCACETSDLPGK